MKTRCVVTKFVYLLQIFLSVALYTAEVILRFSNCRMASCGRYKSFLHEALFTASEESVNLRSLINKASKQGSNVVHLA